jgi:hypothetical protein
MRFSLFVMASIIIGGAAATPTPAKRDNCDFFRTGAFVGVTFRPI